MSPTGRTLNLFRHGAELRFIKLNITDRHRWRSRGEVAEVCRSGGGIAAICFCNGYLDFIRRVRRSRDSSRNVNLCFPLGHSLPTTPIGSRQIPRMNASMRRGAGRYHLGRTGKSVIHAARRLFTSDSRKPDALTRPGNFRFRKTPVDASLSTVRKLTPRRAATTARRIKRGSFDAGESAFGAFVPVRRTARSRARSAGERVGSDSNPDRQILSVVGSIFSRRRVLRLCVR